MNSTNVTTSAPPPAYMAKIFDKNNPKIQSLIQPSQYLHPQYVQTFSNHGWTIVMKRRRLMDGFRIFISEDAFAKYDKFKDDSSDEVTYIQQQGYGIPLFKIKADLLSSSNPMMVFKKYSPTDHHPFDSDKDYFEYCTVQKICYSAYTTYILKFKPNPHDARTKFRVYLFSHTILPINDYTYKGVKHRWIDETLLVEQSNDLRGLKYGFRHTVLGPQQVALTDNWDGKSDHLDAQKKNPYIQGQLRKKLSSSAPFPKPEYYGTKTSEVLCDTNQSSNVSFCGIRIVDDQASNSNPISHYECMWSLKQEDLIKICIASLLKWEKDSTVARRNAACIDGYNPRKEDSYNNYYYARNYLNADGSPKNYLKNQGF